MKKFLFLLTAGWFLCPLPSHGAGTAQARIYCLSLQFQEATTTSSEGDQWRLDVSTDPSGINGELAPYFGTTNYTYSAYLQIYSDLWDMTDQGFIELDAPDGVINADGYPDFFEVAQGVTNMAAAGVLYSPNYYPSSPTFQATWNRAAGSPTGTCSFQVYDYDDPFGSITFTFTFTLLEYAGPLTYTPGSNSVSAAVNLTQTGNPANTMEGPILFLKSSTDRFNVLTNRPGVWTNAALQPLGFTNHIFLRDTTLLTNYFGYLEFTSGDPNPAASGYLLWVLSIDDTNDANGNGIPDFSDDPAAVGPRAPLLALALGSNNLLLTISGDVGHTNRVQQLDSLAATNWQNAFSLLLTNDPQVVSLPLPSGPASFWRVLAQ